MPRFEFRAYLMVDAQNETEAKQIVWSLDGTTLVGGEVGLAVDESEPVEWTED